MRSAQEIGEMRDRLDDNIREHGWDASVDGAAIALRWVLGEADDTMLKRMMERPDAERRRKWIARGGDPKDWPIEPERPAGGEETTT